MLWVWKFLVAWSFTPCTSRFERGADTSHFHASRSGSCALTRCGGPVWGELRGRDTSGVFRRMWSPCGGAGEGWWPTGYSGLWAIYRNLGGRGVWWTVIGALTWGFVL